MNKESSFSLKNHIFKRRIKDGCSYFTTALFSCFTFAILIWMIVYVFQNGAKYLTWDFISGDYNQHSYTIKSKDENTVPITSYFENKDDVECFSSRWGVGFEDGLNGEEKVIYIVSIDENSPFNDLVDSSNSKVKINTEYFLSSLVTFDDDGSISVYGG